MTKRAFYLLLALCLAALAGCGDVESCLEMDTPGCLNSAPRPSGSPCLYDLVLVDGICVKSGGAQTPCGECEAGALCDLQTNTCINFCDTPQVLPGGVAAPTPIFCEAIKTASVPNPEMLTFEAVCRRRCQLNCQRTSQFCAGYQCAAGSCDGADVLITCRSECPMLTTGGEDLACLTKRCNDVRFLACTSSLVCPNGVKPDCAGIACSNTCMFNGANVTGDGVCDDGDTFSSYTAQCSWGTDCADCGPRAGTEEPLGGLGDVCQYTQNCAGGTSSPDSAGAWCVSLESRPGVARCMPDCSRGQDCEDGFSCRVLDIPNADGTSAPVTVGDYTSKACLPDACL
ncbi:MAG TPA: hypothetical protein VFX59_14560 [Polyangiales bacterium]|nr:hypothetical protein [Polyangiales bacterium]